MEHMSKQIDNLSEMLKQLHHAHSSISGSTSASGLQPPLYPPRQFRDPQLAPSDNYPSVRGHHPPSNESEGIESTLFAHVMSATRFVQAAVANDSSSKISAEMTQVLDDLGSVINIQKQQNETLESSHPFSKSLSPGTSFKDLPLPSLDRILTCLRIAHERSPNQLYWPFEFGSLGDFTQYVIKACSPGPVTDMELIIVHYGLFLLFIECSSAAADDMSKQDHEAQALICRDSLETILSNLSIHISTDIDSVCAMYMATIYCLLRGKIFAAWTFISRASLMSQALGLHSNHVTTTEQGDPQRKTRLFWAMYVLEKAMSLRLGRPSTIRDCDITVPRPHLTRTMTSLLHNRLPDWIDVATLYGRVYDKIYSPSALMQPAPVRESHIRALAAEYERIMTARMEFYKRPDKWTTHTIPPLTHKLLIHATRATDYSILACIYRGLPTQKDTNTTKFPPSPECLSAARASLTETESCMGILADNTAQSPSPSPSLDTWVTEVFLLAPFMPFLILFCNIVETSDRSDLARLQRLVSGLQTMVRFPRHVACKKQLRILNALYDVAARYVDAKARGQSGSWMDGPFAGLAGGVDTCLSGETCSFGAESLAPSLLLERGAFPAGIAGAGDGDQRDMNHTLEEQSDFLAMQPEMSDGFGTELDTSRVQLESWFHQSHQMMRFLDDFQ